MDFDEETTDADVSDWGWADSEPEDLTHTEEMEHEEVDIEVGNVNPKYIKF